MRRECAVTSAGVFLYGVINASPDSLNSDSIVRTPADATARAQALLDDGADGFDLGGQGSTDFATVVPWQQEWERLEAIVPALAAFEVPFSVDTWRPEVMRLALQNGATVMNAAEGMQTEAMWEVAAEFADRDDLSIIVPFLSGPNPRAMAMVDTDPVDAIRDFFTERLIVAERYGLRDRCVLDPGTGFAPPDWPWEQRYVYQKRVYTHLDDLRDFGLPLYIALPWKETVQHDELLEIVVAQQPEFGRVHYPAKVRQFEARLIG